MFKRSIHRRLVAFGAPELPRRYYYYPRVVFLNNVPVVRMEVRKSHLFGSTEASRWTIYPETYFKSTDSADESRKKTVTLCVNAARACDEFEVEVI